VTTLPARMTGIRGGRLASAAIVLMMTAACSAPDAAELTASTQFAASGGGAVMGPTPAEQRIAAAEAQVQARPDSPEARNELALAYARRARETADPAFYARAEEAIEVSLKLAPDNFEALKMRTWVLLGKHEFAAALELAKALNKRMPDDLLVYGFLTDAHVELGQYKEAEEACQWMLDLRPGNIPAFTRAAYLRELFGDVEGAMELMTKAYDRTPPAEAEDRAWLLTQVAHLARLAGNTAEAERLLLEAFKLFPRYHYALAQLAKIRTSESRHAEAALLLQQRYDAAPHPENLYDLARALGAAGRTAEAKTAFATFEQQARAESEKWDNANRELTFYYLDVVRRTDEGLRIAARELARRQDVYTLDAYAWALHANRRTAEAREAMRRALDVGVADPEVRAHAKAMGVGN
jgi:tetratricopeptide (TPR) repeat protein